jgi:hypothetical protein
MVSKYDRSIWLHIEQLKTKKGHVSSSLKIVEQVTSVHERINLYYFSEMYMTQNHQTRLFGSRGSSGSRRSSSGSRGSIIRTGGGSRPISPGIRYRIRSTGANIIRQAGSLWSRTRNAFLPISHRYFYRTRSSTNRYTTPSTGSITYYYCSTNDTVPQEIQCSSIYDDTQCCEDETTHDVFCCGAKIGDDLDDDYNRATKLLAQIFYTLSAMALLLHIFRRRFYQ